MQAALERWVEVHRLDPETDTRALWVVDGKAATPKDPQKELEEYLIRQGTTLEQFQNTQEKFRKANEKRQNLEAFLKMKGVWSDEYVDRTVFGWEKGVIIFIIVLAKPLPPYIIIGPDYEGLRVKLSGRKTVFERNGNGNGK